jgi:quinol---cytochrome c reductase iron-sulfur subunit, bacillus type
MGESKELSRRHFMQSAIWGIGGLIGTIFGLPAIIYIVGPSLKNQQTQTWMRLGPTSKVELGTPTLFSVKVKTQTGWIVNEEEISVYVLTNDGRTYIAMSNICTHLGCHVRWIAEQNHFFCPCHNGEFDPSGNVIAGPPPRPLNRYDVKVEAGQLYVLVGG